MISHHLEIRCHEELDVGTVLQVFEVFESTCNQDWDVVVYTKFFYYVPLLITSGLSF